jgi:spermidine synthase
MAGSLERRPDGSIALFINGDLQFDSLDEAIYHESMALPALMVASGRKASKLKALIIGGGDGLIARELFKSDRIQQIDLVDYDPEILALAKNDFLAINDASLLDGRIKIHVQDAWAFMDKAVEDNSLYDLIIVDLTVPDDLSSAKFHTIEWYGKLSRLAGLNGVIATNGVSPAATPEAFWCVFNSILGAGLNPRPYHITIPSFTAQGFGDDWAFFLAANRAIGADELDGLLELANPRRFLRDRQHLLSLFELPEELFQYQAKASPALVGSDILLHYFYNSSGPISVGGAVRSTLSLDTCSLLVPQADTGKNILPREISEALEQSLYAIDEMESDSPTTENAEIFLYGVLDLMPSLKREHTKEMIDEFLEDPATFLQAIDLPGLVARLLKRAAELPSQLVAELELLRDKLVEWAGDHLSLLNLGRRVVTVLMLVLILGNLLYPDMVYGKGEAGHEAAGHGHAAAHRGGRGYGGGGYWNGTNWVGGGTTYVNKRQVINEPTINRPSPNMQIHQYPQNQRRAPAAGSPSGMLDVPNAPGVSQSPGRSVDLAGTVYPARRYNFDPAQLGVGGPGGGKDPAAGASTAALGAGEYAPYRLGPGADILASGHIVMPLTEQSYLLVTGDATHIIDQQDGASVFALHSDANLLALLSNEIERQSREHSQDSQPILNSLNSARATLVRNQEQLSSETLPALNDGVEVFPSVWVAGGGKYLAIRCANGMLAYLKGGNWYSDQGSTPLKEAYPSRFRAIAVSYLSRIVRDYTSTKNMFEKDKQEIETDMAALLKELSDYQSSPEEMVLFGTRKVAKEEAIRLTDLSIRRAKQKVDLLEKNLAQLPGQIDLAEIALAHLES